MSDESNQLPNDNASGKELNKIEQHLTKVNPTLFSGVSDEKKIEILRGVSMSLTIERKLMSHQGPIPYWEDLEKYAQIIPNGADRIMAMAEKQQDHRMTLETKAINEQLFQSKLGQIFGLIVGLTAILGGVICILYGKEWSGAFLGGGGLTGLVSVFVIGKNKQSKSLENKNQMPQKQET